MPANSSNNFPHEGGELERTLPENEILPPRAENLEQQVVGDPRAPPPEEEFLPETGRENYFSEPYFSEPGELIAPIDTPELFRARARFAASEFQHKFSRRVPKFALGWPCALGTVVREEEFEQRLEKSQGVVLENGLISGRRRGTFWERNHESHWDPITQKGFERLHQLGVILQPRRPPFI